MSNTPVELPEGAVALPAKIQARITERLTNIQNIGNQANAAIQSENAFILETIESYKDAMGIEGQYALLSDASALVPHVQEAAPVTETHDAAPVETAERTHNNEGDQIGGDCAEELQEAHAETETAQAEEATPVAEEAGVFDEELAQAEEATPANS